MNALVGSGPGRGSVTIGDQTLWLIWGRGGGHIVNRKATAEAGWDDDAEQFALG